MTRSVTQYASKLPTQERLAQITVDITEFEENADMLQEQADRAVIETEEDYAKGGDLIKVARVQAQKADDLRKQLGSPFHRMHRFINDAFKPLDNRFDRVRKTVEAKMVNWKQKEDDRRGREAEAEARRLEEEALEEAEAAGEEEQGEILDDAAARAQQTVESGRVGVARGNYGSSTSTTTVYSTEVHNLRKFLAALPAVIEDLNGQMELDQIVDLKKKGLNTLARIMLDKGIEKINGADFKKSESLRVR